MLELPGNLRLPPELDPLERENRDLKRQIARIEVRMPKLSVAFEGGAQHHLLSLRDPDTVTVTPLEQVRADNPYLLRQKSIGRPHDRIGEAFADIRRLTLPLGVSADRMVAYDGELHRYFHTYENFLDRHTGWREAVCLHHLFKWVVANEAGQPHIKLLSHQYLTAIVIIKSSPNALLPDTDLRTLALEQIHRHVPNHT